MYDIANDKWEVLPELLFARNDHAMCTFKGRFVFVFCGQKDASIEVLDLKNKSEGWQEFNLTVGEEGDLACLPNLVMPATIQVSRDEIIIFGGKSDKIYLLDVSLRKLRVQNY